MSTTTAFSPTLRVLLPLPLGGGFDYLPPEQGEIVKGALVEVPFGKKRMIGMVMGEGAGNVAPDKLKRIVREIPAPPLPDSLPRFVDWVANYTMSPAGAVLKMVFGGAMPPQPPKPQILLRAVAEPDSVKEGRRKVLDVLAAHGPMSATELREQSGASPAVILAMKKAGLLEDVVQAVPAPPCPAPDFAPPRLTGAQKDVADQLVTQVQAQRYSATLLDGVTGAGKTEVYGEAVAACLRAGGQALILMPEIALTTAMLDRFAARFGCRPVEWHSDVGDRQKRANWWACLNGTAKLIVGARSSLFLPYRDLGLIVVDEEHDPAFKQEEGVIYNARDMAVVRAHLGQIPVVLSSATPSLETYVNATSGRYTHLTLPDRFGGARMPRIELVDMRAHKLPPQSWLSPPLVDALKETIGKGQQAMLFLNRRGYAPLTLCRSCGHRMNCPNCSAWLVKHKHSDRLHCHHCGHVAALPKQCPACGTEDRFAACGPGVERVAEEVAALFPDFRAAIMASDLLDSPRDAQTLVKRMQAHELDLLIGTQIMAKGYHFPRLTLVGIIDADLGLSGGDPRAAERTFQMLQQVAGRSGRGEEPGMAMLQTFSPQHPVMQALKGNDRDNFLAIERAERQTYDLPPFSRLAAFILSGPDAAQVDRAAAMLAAAAPQDPGLRVLGPAPAPLALLRGRHRRRLLLRCPHALHVQPVIHRWLAKAKLPPQVKLQVDIDPVSFL